jgi:chemosensory pili system protein ChpA (sensor histidine kinase/response regulator)
MSELSAQPLEIVSDELGVTLNDARIALEQFAEGEGSQHLERCAALLHVARGVLQLTETYGASLLAEEMEQACRFLLEARRQDAARDEAIDALMRAAVQLPAYVDRILGGGRDLPLVLLPLLNDLRAVRGRPLLSESTLLLLNVARPPSAPGQPARSPSGQDIQALCRDLRPRFQLALLGLIRGDQQAGALQRLAQVAEQLEAAATLDPVHQLWWVVGGVVEALREQGLEPSVSIKRLLGQADREMRRLHAQGEAAYARQPPTDLVNNLLYYVARAQGHGERVVAIREAFNLSGLLPGDTQVEVARQSLGAPSIRLMQTVAGAIREDLGRVKDVLDIYLRTGMDRPEELVPQVEMLKKIGDTLGVLGLGELRERVQDRRRDLEVLVAGAGEPDEALLVEMAADLLAVEDRLEAALIGLIRPAESAATAGEQDASEPENAEFAPVARAALRECLVNLVRIKETITEVTEHGGDSASLDAVPGLLRGLVAALMMLGREAAAGVAAAIIERSRDVVRQGYPDGDRRALDRLADAIVSLEYYLETLQAGRKEPAWMLDNARRSLDAVTAQALVPEPAAMVTEEELPATLVATRVRSTPDAERPVIAGGEQRIDPEILELFIEEAREATDTINDAFPAWLRDEDSSEALQTVRRAFHTLKGSGRIVGAELIGEYCWSVEKILNRLIDGSLARSAGLLALLQRTIAALPELLEQLEIGATPGTDIAALMAEAERWVATPRPAPGVRPAPAPPRGPVTGIDPVLLDILTREMDEHLAVVRDFIARAAQQPGLRISEALHRAVHTLHGSLTMAKVTAAAPVTRLLQAAVEQRHAAGLAAEPELVAACAAATDYLVGVMDHLQDQEVPSPESAPLLEQLEALAAATTPAATDADTLVVASAEPATGRAPAPVPAALPSTPPAAAAVPPPASFDMELAAIFSEEAAELLEAADAGLRSLERGVSAEGAIAELRRLLHTLKGGARMAGLYAMGDLSHELESLLLRVEPARLRGDLGLRVLVQRSIDQLHQLRDQVAAGGSLECPAGLLDQLAAAGGGAPGPAALPIDTAPAEAGPPDQLADSAMVTGLTDFLPAPAPEAAPEPGSEPESMEWPAVDADADAEPEAEAEVDAELMAAAMTAGAGVEAGHLATPPVDFAATSPSPSEAEAEAEAEAAAEAGAEAEAGALGQPQPEGLPVEPAMAAAMTRVVEEFAGLLCEPPEPPTPEPGSSDDQPVTVPARPLPALDRLVALARELQSPPAPAAAPAAPAAGSVTQDTRGAEPREVARVDAGLLEQLLNSAGEISIANARLTQQLSSIQFHLEELDRTVVRLRNQLRKLEMETEAQILFRHQDELPVPGEFDPLELDRYSGIQQLSRGLAETASDVSSLRDLLDNLTGDTEALLVQQARTANELQDGLMRTRMVPFEQQGSRLARLVRQVARDAGKEAELLIEGSGELDRQVLEKMLPAFEHLLRNAVVHGIEPPPEREAQGKPGAGTIRIRLHREGAEVVVAVIDDGRGLDVDAIRRKAVQLGYITPELPVTDEEAMQFILRPGFSTADRLTQVAGRGVGMDVVAAQVAKLGGTLAIHSARGQVTTFTIRLPFTLAVTQALVVRAGTELYALPLPTVEGVIRLSRHELEERMRDVTPHIDYAGQRYQLRHLGQFLGLGATRLPDEQDRVSVILVKAGDSSAALVTDGMLDSREVVVKSVGPQLATIRGIAGATILGDGRIVVILDVAALVRSARPMAADEAPSTAVEARQPLALVVDDSITMRRVTQRFLERNGFRVLTAKDGVEAISVLQDHLPDIILLDVEMPRMDGYEFARHVRNNPDTASVPIIMITSRVSEKHRARAIECGVNDYLGKPYQEQALLEAVHNQLDVT